MTQFKMLSVLLCHWIMFFGSCIIPKLALCNPLLSLGFFNKTWKKFSEINQNKSLRLFVGRSRLALCVWFTTSDTINMIFTDLFSLITLHKGLLLPNCVEKRDVEKNVCNINVQINLPELWLAGAMSRFIHKINHDQNYVKMSIWKILPHPRENVTF